MPEFPEFLTQDVLVSCILMGVIALVGLVGNALMLRALYKYRHFRTDFYIVFGSLSIADSIFLLIGVPAQIMDMVQAVHITTTDWCKASFYMTNTCGFIAAYLIVVLAVLRGILLTNRNTIRQPRAVHLVIVSAVLYIIASASSIPLAVSYTSYDGFCAYTASTSLQQNVWLLDSFSAFVPIFIVLVIYFMTHMLGKRYFSDSYSPREKEKSRLVTFILIAFAICQIPYRIASIYDTYVDPYDYSMLDKMFVVKNYLLCLVMADKAVRPILYSKLASDLSEAFDEVINCTYCSKPYTMAPVFDNSAVHAPSPAFSAVTNTPHISSGNSPDSDVGERTTSTSSSASATSQTPLVHKEDEIIEMNDEVSKNDRNSPFV